MKIPRDRDAVLLSFHHGSHRFPYECAASFVVRRGDPIFRNDQFAGEVPGDSLQYIADGPGVILITHLGQRRGCRRFSGSVFIDDLAGVVLHAKKIIVPDKGEIPAEVLFPQFYGSVLSRFGGLIIKEGKCQSYLCLGQNFFDLFFCRYMSFHHEALCFLAARSQERVDLQRRRMECSALLQHPDQDAFHIKAAALSYLHTALAAPAGFHHVLNDLVKLDAHVGLIDRADPGKAVSELLCHETCIA